MGRRLCRWQRRAPSEDVRKKKDADAFAARPRSRSGRASTSPTAPASRSGRPARYGSPAARAPGWSAHHQPAPPSPETPHRAVHRRDAAVEAHRAGRARFRGQAARRRPVAGDGPQGSRLARLDPDRTRKSAALPPAIRSRTCAAPARARSGRRRSARRASCRSASIFRPASEVRALIAALEGPLAALADNDRLHRHAVDPSCAACAGRMSTFRGMQINVRQRADEFGEIGPPKSAAGNQNNPGAAARDQHAAGMAGSEVQARSGLRES